MSNDSPKFALSALVFAGLASVGCAAFGAGSADAESVVADRGSNAAVEAMPSQLDAVARVPLDDIGEPLAGVLFDENVFDPHHSPYSPPDAEFSADDLEAPFRREAGGHDRPEATTIPEHGYACPDHSGVIHDEPGDCPMCGEKRMSAEEFEAEVEDRELFTIDDEDWIDWPTSMDELGSRVALSTLIQGLPGRRPIRGLHSYGYHYHNYPLPPLESEGVTGPAWIGYTVDEQTRRFFDYADPRGTEDTDDDRWIPRVHVTIAIPMVDADEHAAQYALFCLDKSHRVCDGIADVRAEEGLLVIERIDGLDDEDFDRVAGDDHLDTDADGLVARIGHDSPTAALATFLHEDGPGYYGRIDGLRRIATAEYLAAEYDAGNAADDRLEAMTRALRTRLYGDVTPRRDDVAILAWPTDEGLAIDTVASRTEAAGDATPEDRSLPALVFDGDTTAVATWRIDAFRQTSADDAGGSRWRFSGDDLADHLEWFQGAMMAAIDRPFGFETMSFDDYAGLPPELERALPEAVIELVDLAGESDHTGDVASLFDADELYSAAIHIVDRPAPYRFDREHGLVAEFYFRDAAVAERHGAVVEALLERYDGEWPVDLELNDVDEFTAVRVGIGVSGHAFGDDFEYGRPGGKFHWGELAGESRENLDQRFTAAFDGAFSPEMIRWQPTNHETLSQTAIQIGSDTLEPGLKTPVTNASRPALDAVAMCIAAVQAEVASLLDTEAYRRYRTLELDPVFEGLRDCADDHPDAADEFEVAADNWQTWYEEMRH